MPRGPRGPIEKPKDRKKVLLRLWTYIYAHKWMALGAVLLTVASNLLALLGPMLSGAADDCLLRRQLAALLHPVHFDDSAEPEDCLPNAPAGVRQADPAAGALLRRPPDRRHCQPHLLRHRHGERLPLQRFAANRRQRHHGGGLLHHDGGHLPGAGAGVRHHHSHVHFVHPVHDEKSEAPVPPALRKAGGDERLCGGGHHRPEDHQGLPPGGDHGLPL